MKRVVFDSTRIRIELVKKHMSVRDLADKIGVNHNSLYAMLKDKQKNIRLTTFVLACKELGVSMDEVILGVVDD